MENLDTPLLVITFLKTALVDCFPIWLTLISLTIVKKFIAAFGLN